MSDGTDTKRQALSPYGESRVKTQIGDINKLPDYGDAVNTLREQITAEQPKDITVKLSETDMDDEAFIRSGGELYKYTRHALNQLVGRIRPEGVVGMGGYLAVCPPELRQLNFNYWQTETFFGMSDHDKQNFATLRTREDGDLRMIRGVVSKSYVSIDDLPILTQLGGLLPTGAKMRSARGDLRSRYDIIWPSTREQLAVDDTVNVAIHLVNSETGISSLKMEPMILQAKNHGAMILPTDDADVIIRHVGEARKKLVVAVAKTMARIEPFIRNLHEAKLDSVSELTFNLDHLFVALGKFFEFSGSKVEQIKAEFHALNDPTRAGVANAISLAANTFDIDAGEEMQRAAGKLIASGWGSIRNMVKE